jgi:hypothetical protein
MIITAICTGVCISTDRCLPSHNKTNKRDLYQRICSYTHATRSASTALCIEEARHNWSNLQFIQALRSGLSCSSLVLLRKRRWRPSRSRLHWILLSTRLCRSVHDFRSVLYVLVEVADATSDFMPRFQRKWDEWLWSTLIYCPDTGKRRHEG